MSVHLIRGASASNQNSSTPESAVPKPAQSNLQRTISDQVTSEAAVPVVRPRRSAASDETLRQHSEAKETADGVASRIKDEDPESEDAHAELNSGTALRAISPS